MTEQENPSANEPSPAPPAEPDQQTLAAPSDNEKADQAATPTIDANLNEPADVPLAPPSKFVIGDDSETKEFVTAPTWQNRHQAPQPDIEIFLANNAANGGAVGAVVLGLMTIAGAFLTPWSAINGFIGGVMGIWGFGSPKKRMSLIGIALCALGVCLCLVPIQEGIDLIVDEYLFKSNEETPFDP